MSSQTRPISPTTFATAISTLSLERLYTEASELHNSIKHLKLSNAQLLEFPDDPDCKEAIAENEQVIESKLLRIQLIKYEVCMVRGQIWAGEKAGEEGEKKTSVEEVLSGTSERSAPASGSLTDAELAVRLRERVAEEEGGEGVFL